MSVRSTLSAIAVSILLAMTIAIPGTANATVVRIETVLGDVEINLYDNATPITVTNFLNYVQSADYSDSIIHRSVANFIIQGGGFRTDVNAQITSVPANAAITNEPVYSSVRGTIAMAKLGNDPNSATSQWFINLSNNGANLDNQNGGFTVFGEVTGNGMDVVDALAALPNFDFGGALTNLPLQNYSATDYANSVTVTNAHLAIVTAITVIDTTVDSAAGLNPTPTTAIPVNPTAPSGGGGGSTGILALLGLVWAARRRLARSEA